MKIGEPLDGAVRRVVDAALKQDAELYRSQMHEVLHSKSVKPFLFLELLNKLVRVVLLNETAWPRESMSSHVGEVHAFVATVAPAATEELLLDVMTTLLTAGKETPSAAPTRLRLSQRCWPISSKHPLRKATHRGKRLTRLKGRLRGKD